jgi:hypothetical protein
LCRTALSSPLVRRPCRRTFLSIHRGCRSRGYYPGLHRHVVSTHQPVLSSAFQDRGRLFDRFAPRTRSEPKVSGTKGAGAAMPRPSLLTTARSCLLGRGHRPRCRELGGIAADGVQGRGGHRLSHRNRLPRVRTFTIGACPPTESCYVLHVYAQRIFRYGYLKRRRKAAEYC